MTALKSKLLQAIHSELDAKIIQAETMLANTILSRDSESKSSAGDKYETSRAMMQIEQAQNEQQLSKLISFKESLNQLKFKSTYNKVELSSLVQCDFGNFFLAQALGSFDVEGQNIHCLSFASPLGQALRDKKVGDSFEVAKKLFTIQSIS